MKIKISVLLLLVVMMMSRKSAAMDVVTAYSPEFAVTWVVPGILGVVCSGFECAEAFEDAEGDGAGLFIALDNFCFPIEPSKRTKFQGIFYPNKRLVRDRAASFLDESQTLQEILLAICKAVSQEKSVVIFSLGNKDAVNAVVTSWFVMSMMHDEKNGECVNSVWEGAFSSGDVRDRLRDAVALNMRLCGLAFDNNVFGFWFVVAGGSLLRRLLNAPRARQKFEEERYGDSSVGEGCLLFYDSSCCSA
jgi:hypothetical protein